jgi:hypothetical protein
VTLVVHDGFEEGIYLLLNGPALRDDPLFASHGVVVDEENLCIEDFLQDFLIAVDET